MLSDIEWPEDPLPVRMIPLDLDRLTEPCEVHIGPGPRCRRCGARLTVLRRV